MLRDPDETDELLDVLAELHVETTAAEQWETMLADCHPKQRAFVVDPAPRKCALKGRRGGGSYAAAIWLAENWQNWPHTLSLFVAMTKESAKGILWTTLEALDRKYNWGLVFNNLELTATFPNGYQIALKGAKDRVQIEKLRGFGSGLRRVLVDECGSFTAHDALFRYMLESVLSPQLMDHLHRGGGQLALVSSPGVDPRGHFFEKTTGKDHMGKAVNPWATHHWTALDNPFVDARAYLLEELENGSHILDATPAKEVVRMLWAMRDVPMDDPQWHELNAILSVPFRREYLAQWCKDSQSLVYQVHEDNILPDAWVLPPGQYRIILGCDIGWSDGNGFAVAAKSLFSRELYLLHAYYLPQLTTAEIAAELSRVSRAWHTGEIYVDTGGEGQRLLEDLVHYGVHAQPAGKGRKKPRIEYVRSLLETRMLKIRARECQELLTEWAALPWDDERMKHREGFVDDCADAALMALMPLSQLFAAQRPPAPVPGTPEARKAQDDHELAQAVRAGKRIVRRQRVTGRRRLR